MLLLAAPAWSQSTEPGPYASWTWAERPLPPALADTTQHLLPADAWLGHDKLLHASGSFLITLSAQYVLTAKLDATDGEALPVAVGTTLALGLAKEVMDSQRPVNPYFSPRDLVADTVGVLLAIGVVLL